MRNWKSNILFVAVAAFCTLFSGCAADIEPVIAHTVLPQIADEASAARAKNDVPVIHVIVALCDNESQGIVPVPRHLGDGNDPKRNLYWGAAFGVETYFSKSRNWESLPALETPSGEILKRVAYRHKKTGAVLIADAYRGSEIRKSISDFLEASAGNDVSELEIGGKSLQINGGADVIVFVGHNGLMDFKLDKPDVPTETGERDAIILACFSKSYFKSLIKDTGTHPLLWTTNLMAPEAYILHDALEGRLNGEPNDQVRDRAAKAYARFQKISIRASKRLLVTGW